MQNITERYSENKYTVENEDFKLFCELNDSPIIKLVIFVEKICSREFRFQTFCLNY